MNKTRFETGMENLKKIDGDGGDAVIHSLENISPDLGTYIVEFAFGDIYARPGLTLQEREIITLASLLTAGGCEPQADVNRSWKSIFPPPCMSDFPKKKLLRPSSSASPIPVSPKS